MNFFLGLADSLRNRALAGIGCLSTGDLREQQGRDSQSQCQGINGFWGVWRLSQQGPALRRTAALYDPRRDARFLEAQCETAAQSARCGPKSCLARLSSDLFRRQDGH